MNPAIRQRALHSPTPSPGWRIALDTGIKYGGRFGIFQLCRHCLTNALMYFAVFFTGIISMVQHLEAADLPSSMLTSSKLVRRSVLLGDFQKGAERTFIIVTLARTPETQAPASLKDMAARKRLRGSVQSYRDRVISGLNPSHVRITNRFAYIPGFSAEVNISGLSSLLDRPEVAAVEKDVILQAHTAQGIPQMNASVVRGAYSGQGLSIAICDTGIDYTHPRLGNGSFPNTKVIGGYDFGGTQSYQYSQDADPMDESGHGTQCAGIAAGDLPSSGDYMGGVACSSRLYALKITYGNTGNAYLSDLVSAWQWCVTHQNDSPANPIMIISTSFGADHYAQACDTVSPSLAQAAAVAVSCGITVFASSGNSGYCNAVALPSCISNVISVGAVFDANIGTAGFCVDPSSCAPNQETHASCSPNPVAWAYTTGPNVVAPYSNIASILAVFAPSNNASTTTLGGGFSTNFSGTSAACPYAAGAAACMQSMAKINTGSFLSPAALRSQLTAHGDPITYAAAGITRPRVNLGNVDIDGDGMPDGWELTYFVNLGHNGATDTDYDGLSDLQEYQHTTYPDNPDTDSDGYSDGDEVQAGTSPTDPSSHPLSVDAASNVGILFSSILLFTAGLFSMRKPSLS